MGGRAGILFIMSAPSGAGKTSLARELGDNFPDLRHSVSYTTRPPRQGEQEGRDYYFVSAARFREMVKRGELAEWAEVHGERYGTSRLRLGATLEQGLDVLLTIDVQGARQLKAVYPEAVTVFLLPPSLAELKERLRQRGDPPAEIRRRLETARREVAELAGYDYVIVNDTFKEAVEALRAIILAERCRRARALPRLDGLLKEVEGHGTDHR